MPRIELKGTICVPLNELDAVKQALPEHIRLTREEAGCRLFEVEPDPNDPQVFSVYEQFDDQHAFEYHQQRVKASDWGRITVNVERHYDIREITDDASSTIE